MSTAATTAPATLTTLSQLLLSISSLLRSWGRRSIWPVEDMVVSDRRGFPGRRTRIRLGAAGSQAGTDRGRPVPRATSATLGPMSRRDAPGDGDRRLIEAGMVLAPELPLDALLQRL